VQILTDEKAEIETELNGWFFVNNFALRWLCLSGLWERERKLKEELADAESVHRQLQKERSEFRAQCKELIQSETSLTERLTNVVDERDKLRAEYVKLTGSLSTFVIRENTYA
jgi:predicted transcriptional regulator